MDWLNSKKNLRKTLYDTIKTSKTTLSALNLTFAKAKMCSLKRTLGNSGNYPSIPCTLALATAELASHSKNAANWLNVQKNRFNMNFEMTSDFSIQIINSLLHS